MTPEERNLLILIACIIACILLVIILLFLMGYYILGWGPISPVIHVTQASLNNLTNGGTTLLYDLDLSFTSHNPNSNYRIRYDGFAVAYSPLYGKKSYAMANLNSFEQRKSATTLQTVSFNGLQGIVMSSTNGASPSPSASRPAYYDIVVELHWTNIFHKLGFKGADFRNEKRRSIYVCNLKVPLIGSGGQYGGTRCKHAYAHD